jgi:hypothetical protein
MEQRMRTGTPGGSQRANGDLRLEAQQLVDAQRRIADEAARLGKEVGGDAQRRLASEQMSVADRVDALERTASAVGRSAQGKGATDDAARAAADMATALKRQRLGERMRSSAQDMRDGRGTGRERAEAEQQIARALDQAVARLGGGTSADARSLSQQLDESRNIRDRLERLEEQIHQAEAEGRSGQGGSSRSPQRSGSPPSGNAQSTAGGRGGSPGPGSTASLQQLREEYGRELARAREALGRLTQAQPRDGLGGATPEEQVFSQSAPGNEAFKQDFSKWESLRKGLDLALERYESSVSRRLAKKLAEDRLSAGGSERGPDAYGRLIARYYESLARTKK